MASSADNKDLQPKITLHWLEVSRAQRILWLLEELGVKYELKTYKRNSDSLAPPELKQIHPLGKSPIITIEAPGSAGPLVLAESAAIAEYLCDYYGKWLVPQRYQPGKDGQIGAETEAWVRYRMFMHYAEGSFMPLMLISLIVSRIKNSSVPFIVKPVTNAVASRIESSFLQRNFKTHYDFLEGQLSTSPDGGEFLCGKDITAADILMSFPLFAGQSRSGLTKGQYPKVWAYMDCLANREAYKRSVKKIEEVEGEFKTAL